MDFRKFSVIIDTNVLINFFTLRSHNLLQVISTIFSQVYIPLEVKNEFVGKSSIIPDRMQFVDSLKSDSGFYRLCPHHDELTLSEIKRFPKVDAGEAEALAQHQKIRPKFILTDDISFQNAVREKYSVRFINSLFVLCALDILNFTKNQRKIFYAFYEIHKFKSNQLREAYLSVNNYYEIGVNKKTISRKTREILSFIESQP